MNKNKGVALILVLWVIILLTVIASSFALSARTESRQAKIVFDAISARYLAEAGLHRAVYELRNPDPEARWIGDGRPYKVQFGDKEIEVSIIDETGKIDLNLASIELLTGMFASLGMGEEEAIGYAEKVIDWRDADNIKGINGAEDEDYEAEGFKYGSKDALFDTVSELQQILGIDYEMFRRLESMVTVYSGSRNLNIAFASVEALMASEQITREEAQAFIDERLLIEKPGEALPILPSGRTGVVRGGGVAFTIKSKVKINAKRETVLEATIRLGGTVNGRPFRIIRWRDNEHI